MTFAMRTPVIPASELGAYLKGSQERHAALVTACAEILSLRGWPVRLISTTGIPVMDGTRGWRLVANREQRGTPDIISGVPAELCPPRGLALAIEVKTGGARKSAEQSAFQREFTAAGWEYLVVRDSVDGLVRFMRRFTVRTTPLTEGASRTAEVGRVECHGTPAKADARVRP